MSMNEPQPAFVVGQQVHYQGSKATEYPADKCRFSRRSRPYCASCDRANDRERQMYRRDPINAGADHVIAFFNKPLAESKGTSDMVGRARHKGIPIDVINVPTLTKTMAPTVTPTPTPVQPAAPARSLSR